jgi:hypothetical protein
MGHQSYVLLCTETALSNPPVVQPKSSWDFRNLLRSPWITQGIPIVTLYKYFSILVITGPVITHILRPWLSRRTHTGNLLCACFLFLYLHMSSAAH